MAINFEYSPLPGVRASHKRVLRSTLSVYVGAVCGAPEAKLEHPSLSVGRGALRAGAGRPHGHGQPPTTPRIPRRARNPRVRRITASLHAPHSVPWSHTRHPEPRHDEHECEVHAVRCQGHCTVSGDNPRSWGRRIAHLRTSVVPYLFFYPLESRCAERTTSEHAAAKRTAADLMPVVAALERHIALRRALNSVTRDT